MKAKRKYFIVAAIGVLASSLLQFAILSNMKHSTAFEQTVVLFYANLTLILLVDAVKAKIQK